MRIKLLRLALVIGISGFIPNTELLSQKISKDNYTGNWETPTSWNPTWASPQTTTGIYDITINGYITVNGSLLFEGTNNNLIINDTLVILGNFYINNKNTLIVNGNGVLIVRGNFTFDNKASIIMNNYIVVTGDVIKNGSNSEGSFISNTNPEKLFIGGNVSPASLTNNNLFPALNCSSPAAIPYPNSNCAYGNMTDFMNDPLYSFFQTTCTIATPTITAGGPTTFCSGGSVTLTSSAGTTYLWSTGATTRSINVSAAGSYSVKVSNAQGCQSAASAAITVTVNPLAVTPVITAGGPTTFCAGGSVTLSSSAGTTYLWSTGATTQSINVTSAGSYTVKVINATGCQSAASVATIVTVNALPAPPIITDGGPTTFCAGDSVTLTSSAGSAYLWSTGATTQSIKVTTAGSYTVKVTNANGCQSTSSAATIVTVNALPATPTITAGGTTTLCAGGSVTLNSSSGTSYLWSSGATTQSINVTASGSYNVIVTNSIGCRSVPSAATVVTVNALPATPTITAGGPTTFCAGGSVALTSSAGTSYLWSTGATTQSINVNASGSYSVSVTNPSGCQSAASVATIVTVNALPATPTITADGPTTFCVGGSVTLTSSPGTTYLWSTGAATSSVYVTTSGSYSVIVTNANGCQSAASAAAVVTVNSLPATPTITTGGPTTFCDGGSVTLTSSTGTTYLWSTGATTSSINVTASGAYSVSMTDANGCLSAASAPTVVTVNSLPATPTITAGGPITFCNGGSVTLTSSAGTSYLWSTGATTSSINVTASGGYTVRVTDANGCQSAASTPTAVTVNSLPAVPTITAGGPTTFCTGGSVALTSSVGSTYLWSTGATTPGINVTTAGSYTVMITDVNGCQSPVSTATAININALPVVNAGTNSTIPFGTSTTINATVTGTGPFTYSWSPAGQLVNAFVEDPTTINLSASTIYTLTATSASTSCSNTGTVIISISGSPLGSTPTASPTTICAGDNVQLYALPSGGSGSYTYTWTTPAGFLSFVENPIVNPLVTTSYNLSVFDNFTTVNSQVVVTVNALPSTPVITAGGPTTFCIGGSVTLTSSVGSSYLWSTGATTPSINVTTTGSYSVLVTNLSGCQSAPSAATDVTVNALPAAPTIMAGGPTTFCTGGNVTLTSSPGTSYLWSNGATTASIIVSLSGSYTVRVTNGSGCQSAASAAEVVTVYALPVPPVITAGGPTTFCIGGSVTLTSSAGTSYLWSTGATTANINVTSPGSYTVKVTNANGCQSAASTTTVVTVNPLPATPTISAGGPITFCSGGSVTLTSSLGSTYLWSTGATTASINVISSGSYNVRVTNASGCQSTVSAAEVVTVNALPATPVITAGGPTTFCNGGSVTLTSSAGTSYLWSTGATTASINATLSGSFTVRVTNASGCQSAASVVTVVSVNPLPGTPAITASGPTTFCAGDSVTLISTNATSYLWSTGETKPSIKVRSLGSYSVIVTNANGCVSAPSTATAVTVNAIPATPVINASGPITFCAGNSVTLTSSTGTTYLWSTGATTPELVVSSSGNYTVKVTNSNGCKSAASVASVVTVNPIPVTPTITATGPTTFCDGGGVTMTSSPGTSYLWSNGLTSLSTYVTTSGNYSVIVISANGCQSPASVATVITVNSLPATPAITASGPTTFCAGDSITLISSAGTSYLWSTGATTPRISVTTAGSYTVKLINENGCQSPVSPGTSVTVNALPLVSITGSSTTCMDAVVTLTGNPAGGTFFVIDGPGTISGNILTPTGTGNINVEYLYTGVCSNTAKYSVLVGDKPVAFAGSDQLLKYVFNTILEGVLSGTETGEWSFVSGSGKISDLHSPTSAISDLSVGENILLWTVKNGNCESVDEVIITVEDLFIPSVITPNGDNKNDFFIVTDIGKRVELTIINRWGAVEYTNSNYLNDWDGRNMKGNELPADTYFYILKFENGITRKGTVLITR